MTLTKTQLRNLFLLLIYLLPSTALGAVKITEVMYDLEGADGGFEWIEITNTGSVPVDIGTWRLFEGNVNHKLGAAKGGSSLLPGASAIIADKPDNFLSHWPNVAIVLDSAFSLSNTGESLTLKNGTDIVDKVSYTEEMGAKGDGGSLHREQDSFVVALPNPGVYPGERRVVPAKQAETAAKPAKTTSTRPATPVVSSGDSAQFAATAATPSAPLFPWIVGLISIIGIGIVAVVLVKMERPASETLDPADEFEIVDNLEKTL